jgi:hypothetical protein
MLACFQAPDLTNTVNAPDPQLHTSTPVSVKASLGISMLYNQVNGINSAERVNMAPETSTLIARLEPQLEQYNYIKTN